MNELSFCGEEKTYFGNSFTNINKLTQLSKLTNCNDNGSDKCIKLVLTAVCLNS